MARLIASRLAAMLPIWVGVSVITFAMIKLVPGDPAQIMLGERASPAALARIRSELGLDRSWPVQMWRYYVGLSRGDLGRSVVTHEPVVTELASRLPATAELAIAAMFIAVLVGIPAGVLASARRGTAADHGTMAASTVGVSIPIFCLGLTLTYLVAYRLGWLPSEGRQNVIAALGYEPLTGFVLLDSVIRVQPALLWDGIKHLILPALTLATIPTAIIARITRAGMADVLSRDYVVAARARGLPEWRVVGLHALRNGVLATTAAVGVQFGSLLGGAVITESIFAWPGLGRWLWHAVEARDFPAVQGGVLLVATIYMAVNLVVDVVQGFVDPRVRQA